jgi:hypothetical protein
MAPRLGFEPMRGWLIPPFRSGMMLRNDLIASASSRNTSDTTKQGDRTVTREAYAAEIAKMRQERPAYGLLCMITCSRATTRGSALRSSGPIRKPARRAAGQECRPTGSGGSAWTDAVAQERGTHPAANQVRPAPGAV